MSYSSGGLIEAADYNSFVGTSPSGTANKINTIWAVGNGDSGYGQTALSQVSQSGLITATQWATAVNTLNSIKTHQTGSGTGIGAPTSGSLITYLSTFSSSLNTAYSSRLNFASQGSTTTGNPFGQIWAAANQSSAVSFSFTRTVTFASADQARYFFNAGGQLNLIITSVTNNDGTSRGGDLATLLLTNFSSLAAFRARSNGGRQGSGGTLNTNATSIGYYNLNAVDQTLVTITSSTSGYTSDYVTLTVRSNGSQGVNADAGSVITLTMTAYSAARSVLPAPPANPPGSGTTTNNTVVNDSINLNVNHRIDVVYPETSNLTNSWGTVTIS